jgi:GNAT superfamily N-acetyltransferase
MTLTIRKAREDDYPAFAQLFPGLGVDDPVPSRDAWVHVLTPFTLVAERSSRVLGYCFCHEYTDTGYVRHIVVAPEARGAGIGRALMTATAEDLRGRGKVSWALNVKADNTVALKLYESLRMTVKYTATALRFPWSALERLPPGRALVRVFGEERDGAIERQFDLPRGQLAQARKSGRVLLEARNDDAHESLGFFVFDPKFPGAFPSRIAELEALAPLLRAARSYVPADAVINLVAEDDSRMAELLLDCGARRRLETLHLVGPL